MPVTTINHPVARIDTAQMPDISRAETIPQASATAPSFRARRDLPWNVPATGQRLPSATSGRGFAWPWFSSARGWRRIFLTDDPADSASEAL